MADEPAPSIPPADESTAPAAPPADQVSIQLGPDLALYPPELRPAETLSAASPAPEVEEAAPSTPLESLAVAGPAEQEPQQGSRRRANQEAYERGLTEGRAAFEREQQQRNQQQQFEQTQREATQRVEKLFADLESADYVTQDRARQGILQMYRGNQQASALMTTTRQQVLAEMASDFRTLADLPGIDQDGYQNLHSAPSAAELAKRAFDLGKKTRDEQVAKLEAEVQGLRGRLVGSRATPEKSNGVSTGEEISIEQYAALSPKEARKLTPAQVDALTAQMAQAAQRNGRTF
jgi:hypothetical protein